MILKADISKTSLGRYLFLFIFMCGNSKCTRIQKIKNFSGEVNWVHQALNSNSLQIANCTVGKFSQILQIYYFEKGKRLEKVNRICIPGICVKHFNVISDVSGKS